jgi:hypothetical protein
VKPHKHSHRKAGMVHMSGALIMTSQPVRQGKAVTDLLGLVARKGRHPVLQQLNLCEVLRGQQVHTSRQGLSHLDIRRPQPLNSTTQLHSTPWLICLQHTQQQG